MGITIRKPPLDMRFQSGFRVEASLPITKLSVQYPMIPSGFVDFMSPCRSGIFI